MVVEHVDDPAKAFAEVARCLRPSGVLVINTPNLLNYGVMGNAIASRVLPEKWRLRLVHGCDGRKPTDFFPVRYKANTMSRLARLLNATGLQVHKAIAFAPATTLFAEDRKTGEIPIEADAHLGASDMRAQTLHRLELLSPIGSNRGFDQATLVEN
jgi:SAM-dependent methyltransferase